MAVCKICRSADVPALGAKYSSVGVGRILLPYKTSSLCSRYSTPVLRDSGLSVTMPGGGTRPGEEVRDGPHSDNRGSGNRGGVAPTAAPLRSRAGTLRGSGLYTVLGRAFWAPLLGAAFALPHS
jgi:hypothetical protein